eukprot:NODE_70_length_23697_cov_0.294771.p2 type:complete len:982 gc:universal NODE_70_length_23697_cov_0.294771:19280-16335(-)
MQINVKVGKYSKIVHVKYPSLIASSTFVIPTEGINNKGHAHCLEHKIFMGSKRYPFKGILDVLANRCYANGTNAWTDVDHTAYTLDTVSWEGLHLLLPVYYDHILHPTMTDSAYMTEVHHITPEFKDAGVVYCEMEARENSADDILQHEILKQVYPNSPYIYECGGLTSDIQKLSLSEIVNYHTKYYHPNRTLLIICGTYPDDKLDELILKLDEVAGDVLPLPEKPWSDVAIKPLSQSTSKSILFPNAIEDVGNVSISWLTEDITDTLVNNSISMILVYLTDSSASLLQHYFTELNSYCSSVDAHMDYRIVPNYYVICNDVSVDLLHEIHTKMQQLIKNHTIDFNRLTLALNRVKNQLLYDLENKPSHCLLDIIIPNFLYLKDSQLLDNCNPIDELNILLTKDVKYWQGILQDYIIDRHCVVVVQSPSIELNKKIKSEKSARNEYLRHEYSKRQQELKDKLHSAIKYNERPVPATVFHEFPSYKLKINPLYIETGRFPVEYKIEHNETQETLNKLSKAPIAPFLQCDVYESAFSTVQLWIDTANLSIHHKSLLPLLNSLFFNCELIIDSKVIDLPSVLNELESDALDFHSSCGLNGDSFKCGYFGEYLVLTIRTIAKKAYLGVNHLINNIYDLHITPERVRSALQKLSKDLSNIKRDGSLCTESLFYYRNYTNSNKSISNLFKQHHMTSNLIHADAQAVCSQLNSVIKELQRSSALIHYMGNKEQLSSVYNQADKISMPCPIELKIGTSREYLDLKLNTCYFYAPKSMESGYIQISMNFKYELTPLVALTLEFLETTEGPFWRKIRGAGLAYGCSLSTSMESGLLELYISECNNPFKALIAAKKVVEEYCSNSELLTTEQFEGAKSSLIYSKTIQEKTLYNAANKCFQRTVLCKKRKDMLNEVIHELPNITKQDLIEALSKYIMPLFGMESTIVIVLQQSKLHDQIKEFEGIGYKCITENFEFDNAEDGESEWDTDTSMSE